MTFVRPTTLILGAGASNDYGFPLGIGLRDSVCRGLLEDRFRAFLLALDHQPSEIDAFLDELQHSGYTSVDVFLEENPDFLRIGKRAIAAALLPLEDPQRLFPPNVRPDLHWYEYLINRMGVGTEEWFSNHLSVLTFNYDRSFEHYFTTVISKRAALSDKKSQEAFDNIRFVHLHGSLGKYSLSSPGSLAYGTAISPESIRAAANEILVVSEVEDDLPTFDEAEEVLSNSERIFFLGFGFLAANIGRLRVFENFQPDLDGRPYIGGTTIGFSDDEWKAVVDGPLHGAWDDRRYQNNTFTYFRMHAKWD